MKKTFTYLFLILLALSCTKQQDHKTGQMTFQVTRSDEAAQKTVISGWGYYAVRWNSGDVISIFDGFSNSPFTTYTTGRSVSFKGNASDEAEVWYAVYPYSDLNDFDPDSKIITAAIPSTQTAFRDGFADNTNIAAGYTSTQSSLVLRNVCGYVKFNINSSDITSATIASTDGESIAGEVKISFTSAGIPIATTFEGTDNVVLKADDSLTPVSAGNYCIALLPGTLSNGFTITLTRAADSKTCTFTRSGSFTLERSTMVNIGTIDDGNWN